jgi:uncharacterized protein
MTTSTLGTALITGGSTGIGAAYADRLAQRGYDLILVARDQTRMSALGQKLRSETGREVTLISADLTTKCGVDAIEAILAETKSITLFVNNAGTTLKGGILDNDATALTYLLSLNVTAVTLLMAAAAKVFKARGKGTIINIASTLVFAPEAFDGVEGTYSATKSFLFHLSRSLSSVMTGSGVHAQVVLPGVTRTEIWAKAATPIDALPPEMVMEAGDLVDAALAGLDRGETVTMPTLIDEALWANFEQARSALVPQLSAKVPAPRYRKPTDE